MTSTPDFIISRLEKRHHREEFKSGIDSLDIYLLHYAGQDERKHLSVTYVLLDKDSSTIMGYYTLSATAIRIENLPDDIAKQFPKYPLIPATLLGRMAVDHRYQGKGLGEILLMDALFRSYRHSERIASMAVIVDAVNDTARSFYTQYGFISFPTIPNKLFLTMRTIQSLFTGK